MVGLGASQASPRGPTIFLHIGAMKTGTTYLQGLMYAHREELAAAGYLFPGERWQIQSRAVREMLFKPDDDPRLQRQVDGRWEELRQEMFDHPGRASIVSMEFLSFADAERAGRIIDSLAGAQVHVVITVRDAHRAIPGQWQTGCRNGGRIPYRRFLEAVEHVLDGVPGRGARRFDRTQGIPRMLEVWTPLVGPEQMHVVTVPPSGADPAQLWRRFADAIGVDHTVVPTDAEVSNPSLGYASSELLRLLNRELGDLQAVDYWRIVKGGLARNVLGRRAHLEQRVPLHRRGVRLANRWNRAVRRAIRGSGARLHGDLTDLPSEPPGEQIPPGLSRPTAGELLAAAATARVGLERLHAYLIRRDDAFAAQADGEPVVEVEPPLEVTGDEPIPEAWLAQADPVTAAVAELTGRIRDCVEVHQSITTRWSAGLDELGDDDGVHPDEDGEPDGDSDEDSDEDDEDNQEDAPATDPDR